MASKNVPQIAKRESTKRNYLWKNRLAVKNISGYYWWEKSSIYLDEQTARVEYLSTDRQHWKSVDEFLYKSIHFFPFETIKFTNLKSSDHHHRDYLLPLLLLIVSHISLPILFVDLGVASLWLYSPTYQLHHNFDALNEIQTSFMQICSRDLMILPLAIKLFPSSTNSVETSSSSKNCRKPQACKHLEPNRKNVPKLNKHINIGK